MTLRRAAQPCSLILCRFSRASFHPRFGPSLTILAGLLFPGHETGRHRDPTATPKKHTDHVSLAFIHKIFTPCRNLFSAGGARNQRPGRFFSEAGAIKPGTVLAIFDTKVLGGTAYAIWTYKGQDFGTDPEFGFVCPLSDAGQSELCDVDQRHPGGAASATVRLLPLLRRNY